METKQINTTYEIDEDPMFLEVDRIPEPILKGFGCILPDSSLNMIKGMSDAKTRDKLLAMLNGENK